MAVAVEERAKAARRAVRTYVRASEILFAADPADSDYQRGYRAAVQEVGRLFDIAAPDEGCLGKAADDEPVFILRAQDIHAPYLIDQWARLAEEGGCPPEKAAEARALAGAMRVWPHRKSPD